jgi:hypothetical protein
MSRSGSIWVDLDDVLSHTIEGHVELLARRHGRRVAVEEVHDFDLSRSFGLDPDELARFFDAAHAPDELAGLAPREGAAATLRAWRATGLRVHVVTGRPPVCAEASLAWLDAHEMQHDAIHFVDKYGRPAEIVEGVPFESVEAVLDMGFTWAVEDSLETALRLAAHPAMIVALVDRPWNRVLPPLPTDVARRIVRCRDWRDVERAFAAGAAHAQLPERGAKEGDAA